ncbi:MAG: sugar phosphate isomerase/epimerase family protein [Verrucomicrobiota bacterium]
MNLRRRHFLVTSAAWTSASLISGSTTQGTESAGEGKGRILKSIKFGMLREALSVEDKFRLLQDLGFDGVELNSPGGVDKKEALTASEKLEFPIHGVVNSIHWKIRLSSPEKGTREEGLDGLLTAIRESHLVGGSSVLLVPGKVTDPATENYEQVWKRSVTQIRRVLPLAAELGIRILIENVWNNFLYDPNGDDQQSAGEIAKYLDEINSPWVGSYFDIGNHQKFGRPADWIRQLGRRIVKLDVKDWGGPEKKFMTIGDGDVDWADVRAALTEIGFTGWATAEVRGGDRKRIAEVKKNMDEVLGV